MKVSEKESGTNGKPDLKPIVSWLRQRKKEVDKKWIKAQKNGNKEMSTTYQGLYEAYSIVVRDIIMNNKEAN